MKPNQQNNWWLSDSPEEVSIVMYSKYPVYIMVLGIISSDGDVMEPVFIPDGVYLGANSCEASGQACQVLDGHGG